ncbi:MAG TPA: hypothetical protein VK902_20505, partial [Rubrobacter sp.]|nr:hypothetical protein [Rubrobacter sp.]
QALVSEHDEEERSLEETLLEELYSFVGEGWEQEDDITLLTLRRSARGFGRYIGAKTGPIVPLRCPGRPRLTHLRDFSDSFLT